MKNIEKYNKYYGKEYDVKRIVYCLIFVLVIITFFFGPIGNSDESYLSPGMNYDQVNTQESHNSIIPTQDKDSNNQNVIEVPPEKEKSENKDNNENKGDDKNNNSKEKENEDSKKEETNNVKKEGNKESENNNKIGEEKNKQGDEENKVNHENNKINDENENNVEENNGKNNDEINTPRQGCEGDRRAGRFAGARRAPGLRPALVPRVHRRGGLPVLPHLHRDAARRLSDRIFILTPSIYEIQPDAPGRRARRGRLRPPSRQDDQGRGPVHRKRP